jgi:hypothetical protein
MKKIILPFLIAGSFLTSCDSATTTTETSSDTTIMAPAPDTATIFPSPVMNDTVPGTSSVPPPPPPQALPIVNTQPQSSGKVMLNPAHGQPGHDCAVAVGAPLNAPASKTTVTPTITTTSASAPTSSTVRLNPAHGEPGHDCAVEVGKPLKN